MFAGIQLAILMGRNECNPWLERWASRFDSHRIFRGGDLPDHLACRRNAIVEWFLRDRQEAALWMMDGDIYPISGELATRLGVAPTEDLATAGGPAGCNRALSKWGGLSHPEGLTAMSLLASRALLEKMGPPWFKFTYDRGHTKVVGCECSFFARRAMTAMPRLGAVWTAFPHVGTIGHIGIGVALPDADGRPLIIFPDGADTKGAPGD